MMRNTVRDLNYCFSDVGVPSEELRASLLHRRHLLLLWDVLYSIPGALFTQVCPHPVTSCTGKTELSKL